MAGLGIISLVPNIICLFVIGDWNEISILEKNGTVVTVELDTDQLFFL
jgi:hypothetical protein